MEKIKVSSDGAVRYVTLARGEKRNALDAEMLEALTEAFARGPAEPERVTVIRAEGPVFCAGLDLRERGGGTIGSAAIETMLHAIETYALPVVAVVQGDAIAVGNELALHCDFVIASETGPLRHVARQDRSGAQLVPRQETPGGRRPGRRPRDAAAGRSSARVPNGGDGPHSPHCAGCRSGGPRQQIR